MFTVTNRLGYLLGLHQKTLTIAANPLRHCFCTVVKNNPETSTVKFTKRGKKGSSSLTCPFCSLLFPNPSLLNLHLGRRHSEPISNKLRDNPIETYKSIFGENYKSLTDQELRYDDGLVVTLQGKDKGCWYSFTEGVGGGPLKAIRHVHGFDFLQTLEVAAGLTNLSLDELKQLTPQTENNNSENKDDREERRIVDRTKNIETCKNLWNATVELEDTVAEHYLEFYRGIPMETINRLELRYLPNDAVFLDSLRGPRKSLRALVIAVRNPDGELTGVQRIFLDENGKKADFVLNSKKSLGLLKGSAGLVQKGMKKGLVVIVEGPETGASIASVVGPDATVLAALSVSLLKETKRCVLAFEPSEVILAIDNDQSPVSQNQSLKAHEYFKKLFKKMDIPYRLAVPVGAQDEDSKSTDFNDILIQMGEEELKKQLQLDQH